MRTLASVSGLLLSATLSFAQTHSNKEFASDKTKPPALQPIPVTVLPAPPLRLPQPVPVVTYTPEQLLRMDECQLMEIYKAGAASPVPSGYTPGTVIVKPGSCIAGPASKVLKCTAWQGKWITCDTMTNRQFGVPGIKAAISTGQSWIDGGPTVVFDYEDTSLICKRYRDEVREVSPGIYLGCMHRREKDGPNLVVWFALDARKLKSCGPCKK